MNARRGWGTPLFFIFDEKSNSYRGSLSDAEITDARECAREPIFTHRLLLFLFCHSWCPFLCACSFSSVKSIGPGHPSDGVMVD